MASSNGVMESVVIDVTSWVYILWFDVRCDDMTWQPWFCLFVCFRSRTIYSICDSKIEEEEDAVQNKVDARRDAHSEKQVSRKKVSWKARASWNASRKATPVQWHGKASRKSTSAWRHGKGVTETARREASLNGVMKSVVVVWCHECNFFGLMRKK